MFSRLPGIGLDIGGHKTRLIWVEKKEAGWQLVRYGSINTPPGTVESGCIVDPEHLGEEIKRLVKELKLGGKRVVSAVGGPQLYIRNLTMPSFTRKELKTAVYFQAMKFLPIPVEEAAMDIFPLREFEVENGRQVELFFLAVRKQMVENLKLVCSKAGLKPAVIEIEPLALYRVIGEEGETVAAILSMGWHRSHMTVFKQGVPVLYQSINVGISAFHRPLSLAGGNNREWGKHTEVQEQAGEYRSTDLNRAIKGAVEYYASQNDNEGPPIAKIWLCGAVLPSDWQYSLSRELGVEVEAANILQQLILPSHINHIEKRELQADYQVALGLAAREVI